MRIPRRTDMRGVRAGLLRDHDGQRGGLVGGGVPHHGGPQH